MRKIDEVLFLIFVVLVVVIIFNFFGKEYVIIDGKKINVEIADTSVVKCCSKASGKKGK